MGASERARTHGEGARVELAGVPLDLVAVFMKSVAILDWCTGKDGPVRLERGKEVGAACEGGHQRSRQRLRGGERTMNVKKHPVRLLGTSLDLLLAHLLHPAVSSLPRTSHKDAKTHLDPLSRQLRPPLLPPLLSSHKLQTSRIRVKLSL